MHGSTHAIPTELISYRINHRKIAVPAIGVGVGFLALGAILGVAFGRWSDFMHAYLAAWLFWFGLSIGCLGLTMLHHMTGGRWGEVLRPYLETGAMSIVPMALAFVPVLVFMGYIYPWAHDVTTTNAIAHQRKIWLQPWMVWTRFFVYFGIWSFLAWRLLSKYRLRDEMAVQDPAHNTGQMFRVISAPGLLVLVVTVTLALIDWAMSVQPGWYSTLYGLLFIAGQGLSAFAFMVVVVMLVTRQYESSHADSHHGPLIGKQDWHDFGNLLFAFTMLWGYMSLSQMLITYSGNLPYETAFYHNRSINGWQYVGGLLIVVHFVLPFLLLLLRDVKRDPKKLVMVALFILIVRQLDFYYQIHPSYTDGLKTAEDPNAYAVSGAFGLHTLLNALTPLGVGGLWVASFAWGLRDRRVLPAPAKEDHHG
jgi:hypothetical protein